MRMLPPDLKVPKDPVETCYELSENEKKKLPNFITKASGHTDVELTWD